MGERRVDRNRSGLNEYSKQKAPKGDSVEKLLQQLGKELSSTRRGVTWSLLLIFHDGLIHD